MKKKEKTQNTETKEKKIEDKTPKKSSNKKKSSEIEKLKEENEKLKKEIEEINDKYIRLMAEFDNFRKRTISEKAELIKNASEKILLELLPIVDDFERAVKANEKVENLQNIKEGFNLIYDKLTKLLKKQGVTEIDALHKDFDPELHDALAKVPVEDPNLKGKIVDIVEKGYYLNDKILRHSKVVIGE